MACKGFAVYMGDPSRPYLVLTYTNAGPKGWGNPFLSNTSSRALKSSQVYHIHANGTNIASYTLSRVRQEDRYEGSQITDDVENYFDPTPNPSVDPTLPLGRSNGDRNCLDVLEDEGYERLLLFAAKTRFRAGIDYTSTESDFLCGPLATYSHSQTPLLSTSREGETSAQPRHDSSPNENPLHLSLQIGDAITPFSHSFPTDIAFEILEYLCSQDIQNFALANRKCNELASRRLWRVFYVRGQSAQEAFYRCQALLRLPGRTAFIRRLVVGPCRWAWHPDLLDCFSAVWKLVPRLQDLMLEPMSSFRTHDGALLKGVDYAPLLRTLLEHGQHLQLQVFKCEAWLRPCSPLLQFLESQPSIRELIGVDVLQARPPELDPRFLPHLSVLICDRPITAAKLSPSRPLQLVQITDCASVEYDLGALAAGFEACTGPLTAVYVSLPRDKISLSSAIMTRFIQSCSRTVDLTLSHMRDGEISELPLTFASVRNLIYYSTSSESFTHESITRLVNLIAPHAEHITISSPGFSGRRRRDWVQDSGPGYVSTPTQSYLREPLSANPVFDARNAMFVERAFPDARSVYQRYGEL